MELTIKEYLTKYIENKLINIEYSYSDMLRIVAYYLDISKEELYLVLDERKLNIKEQNDIEIMLNKMYFTHIPLQYIINKQPFYNEEYFVNENVLIPRQDTEILVEKAIEYINKYNFNNLLDMCTGSGCIGISISNNSNIKEITLVDVSNDALEVTKKNIKLNKVEKDVIVVQSDLFSNLEKKQYDIIVSNPPYIKSEDIASLESKVKNEPHLALDGGIDGLDIYRRILKDAKEYLHENSILMFEIGYDELEDIKKLIDTYKKYSILECVKDLGNNDRVIICKYNEIK